MAKCEALMGSTPKGLKSMAHGVGTGSVGRGLQCAPALCSSGEYNTLTVIS